MASGEAWRARCRSSFVVVASLLSASCSLLNEPRVSCDPIAGSGCSDPTLTCQLVRFDPETTDCVSLTSPPHADGASCGSSLDCYGGYACANGICTQLCAIGDASSCDSQPAQCVAPSGSNQVYGFCVTSSETGDEAMTDMAAATSVQITCDPVADECSGGDCKVVSISPPGTSCVGNGSTEGLHDGDPCMASSACHGALSCINGHCRGLCDLPTAGGEPDPRCGFLYDQSDVCVAFDGLPWGICCPPEGC